MTMVGCPLLEAFPKYVFEDMLKAIKSEEQEQINRTPYRSPIALSCHIQCHTSIHQGDFERLSGFGNPVVFNNTCASSHQLAVNLLDAGARCYIGTLWRVGNETARQAAISFYESVLQQRNLLAGFHQMLEQSTLRGIAISMFSGVYTSAHWRGHRDWKM